MSANDCTAVFMRKVMPRFSKSLRRRLAISLSSMGRHSFRYSMTVTSMPKRWNTEANSIPMTPAPMMHSLEPTGRESGERASSSVEVTTRGSSMSGRGRSLGLLPVAMMILFAARRTPSESSCRGRTCTSLGLTNEAWPRISLILGWARMPSTPLRNCCTTAS